MFKKLTALLLAVFCVAALFAACGDGPDAGISSDTVQSGVRPSDTDKTVQTDMSSAEKPEKRTFESVMGAANHYVGLTDQGNKRLVVYDLAVEDWSKPEAVVWEKGDISAAGIKFRYNEALGGYVVLYCGGSGAGIISYETKEILFQTKDLPTNPHSVELLPDGTFLVSGTQGQAVHAFNPFSGSKNRTARISVPDGHGLLWVPENEMLWTAGAHNIDSYAVTGGPEKPVFTPIYKYSDLPSGIHDLAPVYGDTSKLWFTSGKGVLQLDKETGKYSRAYSGTQFTGNNTYTPGVGNFPDGVLVWVVPTNKSNYWTTDIVHLFVNLDGVRVKHVKYQNVDDSYYKCRVWISDYQ